MASVSVLILPYIFILHLFVGSSFECLYEGFYAKSCPKLFSIIKPVVEAEIEKDNRMGASILRLFFHDCFVNGCDGSILLADTPTSPGEQHALPNNGSIRGLKVIEKIKTAVEKACPGIVSCADILAIAARDSVTILGGPSWKVKLGRRDSTTANGTLANTDIPSPTSNLSILITMFAAKSLSIKDMVALSGAHTIGLARCVSFRSHIYNDSNINSNFASIRKKDCPTGSGGTNLASLDFQTPTTFDNSYYKDLINQRGLMHSDQELFNNGPTDSLVQKYSESKGTFHSDFVKAMIKMGHVTPLSGSKGEIRKVCSKIN